MKVNELKSLLENIPGETEVTIWADAAECCISAESAFHLVTDDKEELPSQFALLEKSVDLQDIVKRGFRLKDSKNERED